MPADDAPWQPWTPRPGQRVRVRRSAECRAPHHIRDGSDDGRMGTVQGDFPLPRIVVAHDDIGTIRYERVSWSPPPVRRLAPGHEYWVRYDEPIPTGVAFPSECIGQWYAAIELEPADR